MDWGDKFHLWWTNCQYHFSALNPSRMVQHHPTWVIDIVWHNFETRWISSRMDDSWFRNGVAIFQFGKSPIFFLRMEKRSQVHPGLIFHTIQPSCMKFVPLDRISSLQDWIAAAGTDWNYSSTTNDIDLLQVNSENLSRTVENRYGKIKMVQEEWISSKMADFYLGKI
jgi:hypothetical protein